MFGCGNYPAFPEILESIRVECIANVGRLRHHPSIVIYAGNNEDYQVQESFGLTYNYEDKDPKSWLNSNFPARYIYEKVSADTALPLCQSAAALTKGSPISCFPMSSMPKALMCRITQEVPGETD